MSSTPVALFTLRFCNCWCMNEAETGGMSNSIPSGTLLSTKLLRLELLYVRFLPLELRSFCSDVKNSLN